MSGAGVHLPMGGFYQFGYVTRDLDAATALLRDRYGVACYRRARPSDWMETAHAWTGTSMIEVIAPGEGAPALYLDYLPSEAGTVRLHHLGRRIDSVEDWAVLEDAIRASGLDMPFGGAAMGGDLRFAYVDTRADLGIYSEYVCLTGAAAALYDDIPHN